LSRVLVGIAFALPFVVVFACGGRTSLDQLSSHLDGGSDGLAPDASSDVHAHDSGADVVDAAPDVHVPLAPACVRDGGAPPVFDGGLPAKITSEPQVVAVQRGAVPLPTFVSITFAGDSIADDLDDFVASLGCTDHWRQIASDYGVGQAVATKPIHLAEQAPAQIDDTEIASWLENEIATDARFPKPDGSTIYAVFYPETTTVTLFGGTSCQSFDGYHYSFAGPKGNVPYAVMPRCPQGQFTTIETVTIAASHELIEATTDPFPDALPGYELTDGDHLAFGSVTGAEVGDMCEVLRTSYYQPQGYPFFVQRSWSNRAAAAGTDPCVPAFDPSSYFYAAPVMLDTISVPAYQTTTMGVKIGVGQKATIDVAMIASGNPGTWSVQAVDGSQLVQQGSHLSFTFDKTSGQNGDTLKLTITKNSNNNQLGAEPFALFSRIGGRQTIYWGLVGHP
jgi:hypothetical protein